jgi:hypothetical protein
MTIRPSLNQLGLSAGKKTRLYRILHEYGLRNGTAIFLPYDHGLEHGPRDFAGHPDSGDPKHIIKLASAPPRAQGRRSRSGSLVVDEGSGVLEVRARRGGNQGR